ncbi:MAG: ATP-dependent helicase [Calditrichia bacterium]
MSDILATLNPSQKDAVEHLEGPILVLAGAGSGKTRVLTYRIANLLQKGVARPHEILAVTFTNKAAREMQKRIESLISSSARGMWIGTFHSICARILRMEAHELGYDSNFTIYDVDDQLRLLQNVMAGLNISTQTLKPRQVQYRISDSKNKMITPERFDKMAMDYNDKRIAQVYHAYEKAKRRNNAFDFDDLLIKPLDVFTKHEHVLHKYQSRFRQILVDEYQDTNKAQYYFIKHLSSMHRNICVVGDEDQSIYRWRGADIENILNFGKDYPEAKTVRLEQNYRSTTTILEAANAVVSNNERRLGKELWSKREAGSLIAINRCADEASEAAQIVEIIRSEARSHDYNYNDFAVLYRTNAQSRAMEDRLRRANIPYTIVGGTKFYDRKEVKDILAYLRVLVNPLDGVAMRRIVNFPPRGIGDKTQQHIEQYATEKAQSLFQAVVDGANISTLSARVRTKIQAFGMSLQQLREKLETENAYLLAQEVAQVFGLKRHYEKSTLVEDETRLENINELLNSIAAFVETEGEDATLSKYLEDVALLTDVDRWDPDHQAITLMTLHSAKGLEFPVVVLSGMEDGLFPLFRSLNNPEDLEEERRLFYVGMTRAMNSLYLLWTNQRRRFTGEKAGMMHRNTPSRFLLEIPASFKNEPTVGRATFSQTRKNTRPRAAMDFAEQMLSADSKYKIGDWVQHESFGKGQVLGVEGSGSGTKLTVLFQKKQLKKLIAEYANLTVLNT